MTYRSFFPAVFIGLLTILVIAVSFSLVLSLFFTFTSFTENSAQWLMITVSFIAMFLGGALAGAKGKEKGWLAGACTALLFSIITFLIQYLGYNHHFTTEQYLYHGGYILVATLGGMIGVNLTKG